jgi:ribosomal protein L11 methyltransferase
VSPPARWLVLSVRGPSGDLVPLIAEGLLALGGTAVLEEADAVTTFLRAPDDPVRFANHAQAILTAALPPGTDCTVEWRWHHHEDWGVRWKQGLGPRVISERLVVKPTWSPWETTPGQVVIDIDPQMAFGTSEHATTRSCLRLMDGALRPGDRVIDVGSGSAILAIAAARLGAAHVVAVEYDADANLNARENLQRNGVMQNVELLEARADAALLARLGGFDLIVANILSSVIRPLLPAFRDTLRGSLDGRLIVSGILHSEHPAVLADSEAAGFELREIDEEEEWWSALLAARISQA